MKQAFGVFTFDLLPGVGEADFETFFGNPNNSALDSPGVTFHMLKGDRGERKNRYALLLEFTSIEARNQLFPVEGEGASDEVLAAKIQGFLAEMGKLVQWPWRFTDYVDMIG